MNNKSGKRIVEYTLIIDGDVPTEELGIHILEWLDKRFGATGALIPKDEGEDYWDEAADWDYDEDEDEDYRELERLTRCIGCGKGNIWCECDPDNLGKWDFNFLDDNHPYKGSHEEIEHIVQSMETLKEKIENHIPLTKYEVRVWEKHRGAFKPEWFEDLNPCGFIVVDDLEKRNMNN